MLTKDTQQTSGTMIDNIICPFTPSHFSHYPSLPLKNRNMKKTKIMTVALMVAALAAGCAKDENVQMSRLRLLAEGFSNANSKVLVDPTNPRNPSNWEEGEKIKLKLNDDEDTYTIAVYLEEDQTRHFGLKDINNQFVGSLESNTLAYYPGESFDGNEVTVSNNQIELIRLAIDFTGDKQKMAFPMVAKYKTDDNNNLYFRHLTAGMQIKLHANSALNGLKKLKIVAQSNTAAGNLNYDGVTARWAVQGPTVPSGAVGSPDGLDAKYASEMNFDFVTVRNIDANGDLTFCIPITLSHVDKLIVTGYDAAGVELFHKNSGTNALNVNVDRNKMYNVPPISIN